MSTPLAVSGQSLRVNATLGADITGASSVVLKYRPPTGDPGQVAATVDNAATGAVHGDIPAATLTAVGDWAFWAVAVLASGETCKTYGSVVRVLAEGTVVAGAES